MQGSRSHIKGIEVIDAVISVKGDTARSRFDISLTHRNDSICTVVGDDLGDTEQLLIVVRVSVVDYSEQLVHRQHKVGRHLFDESDAVRLLSQTEKQAYGVVDDPSVEVDDLRRRHFKIIVAVIIRYILNRDRLALWFRSSSKQIIA